MKNIIKKLLRENLIKERVEYYTQDQDDEYQISKVTIDDYHRYERCEGVLYELSGNGDMVVYVSEIKHTEGNEFYQDQVDRYVKYIDNGGILESFPVYENPLGGAYTLEEMCEYLSEPENFDLMYGLVNVNESKAHTPLYDALDGLSYDSESFGLELTVLPKIKNLSDLNKYYGNDYLSHFNEEEVEDNGYYWEPEYYQGFKNILEYWSDTKEYSLTNMNHRFMAIKELGISKVFVETL